MDNSLIPVSSTQLTAVILVALGMALILLYHICKFLLRFIWDNIGRSGSVSVFGKNREEEKLLEEIIERMAKLDSQIDKLGIAIARLRKARFHIQPRGYDVSLEGEEADPPRPEKE